MEIKNYLCTLLAAAMLTSYSVSACAYNYKPSDTESVNIGDSRVEPRSFYRYFRKQIDGLNEKKVAWDINAGGDKDYQIYLNNNVPGDVAFRLEVGGEDYEFLLSPGETHIVQADTPSSFSLFATFIEYDRFGTCSGTIALGSL